MIELVGGDFMVVSVWVVPLGDINSIKSKQRYIVKVSPYCTPDELVYEVIRKRLVPQGEAYILYILCIMGIQLCAGNVRLCTVNI